MKKINPIKLNNAFTGLKLRFPAGLRTEQLKYELKRLGVSFSSEWQSAFRQAEVIYKSRWGEVEINPTLDIL